MKWWVWQESLVCASVLTVPLLVECLQSKQWNGCFASSWEEKMRKGVCDLLNIKQTKPSIFFLLLSLFTEERKTTFTECFSLLLARSYYIISSCINLQDLMAGFPFSIGGSPCPFGLFLIYFHFTLYFFFLHYIAHLLLHIWSKELFLILLSQSGYWAPEIRETGWRCHINMEHGHNTRWPGWRLFCLTWWKEGNSLEAQFLGRQGVLQWCSTTHYDYFIHKRP